MSVSLFSGTFFLLLFNLETSVYAVQQYWFCHSTKCLILYHFVLCTWCFVLQIILDVYISSMLRVMKRTF